MATNSALFFGIFSAMLCTIAAFSYPSPVSAKVATVTSAPAAAPTFYGRRQQEAEIVALETSGFIVPVQPLVQKIMRDLKSIRTTYRQVEDTTIKRKWVPGEVVVRGKVSNDVLNQIDNSVYGPLEEVKKFAGGSVLVFTKAYHPEVLSQRLSEKYGINVGPNTSVGSPGNTIVTYKPKDNVYVFQKGPAGFTYPGYTSMYTYEFQVRSDGNVNLRSATHPGSKI